jgi:hypothetical protein
VASMPASWSTWQTRLMRPMAFFSHIRLALADSGYAFPSREAIDRLMLLTAGPGGEDNIENG